jgi:methylated-DNA-[protein]-cysteine S-methyltransferase
MIGDALESIEFETPTGPFILTFAGPRLISTGWPALGARFEGHSSCHDRARQAVRRRFEIYFESGRAALGFLEFETPIGTPFQSACWKEARRIEAGSSRSYGWLAERIGRPKAARAVGQAMRANPLPIVVPCHRVVGLAPGSGGFSGSTGRSLGMSIKRKLLELEQPT